MSQNWGVRATPTANNDRGDRETAAYWAESCHLTKGEAEAVAAHFNLGGSYWSYVALREDDPKPTVPPLAKRCHSCRAQLGEHPLTDDQGRVYCDRVACWPEDVKRAPLEKAVATHQWTYDRNSERWLLGRFEQPHETRTLCVPDEATLARLLFEMDETVQKAIADADDRGWSDREREEPYALGEKELLDRAWKRNESGRRTWAEGIAAGMFGRARYLADRRNP